MGVEVTEHIKHGLEPQVLDMTLAVTVQRKAEVLGLALEVEGQHTLPRPSLTLADHKEAMAPRATGQHKLGRLHPGQCPMEPGVVGKFQLSLSIRVQLSSFVPWVGCNSTGTEGQKEDREVSEDGGASC